ncbi:hypothetical protein M413DRAFT_449640 [Hebeloma cylindrosporum]|uniref:Thioredoxin domain-containing protein n=1 Tax=Hebeloma cylindrosporum TaxID=76867 RepID=A0A0C2Y3F7_HEBCY|nr:hypothetical protein M413DRAFT_449640 [Hebeloma cylindrosporum h7]
MPSQYVEGVYLFKQVIASNRPSIICLGFDPSVNPTKWCYGCDRLLPHFESMSNHPGFRGIDFYRVDCDESPDIWKFCGPDVYPPAFIIFQNSQFIAQGPAETLRDLQTLIAPYYSGPGVFPFPNPNNASRDGLDPDARPRPGR